MEADGQPLPVVRADGPRETEPVFSRVAIVGLGLMGGSLGLALRRAWPGSLVIGIDRNEVLETAMRMHAIDVAADDLVVAAEADLVVLAAPLAASIRVLPALADNIPGEAVVTDLGAAKRTIVEAARQLPPRLSFVGGHALAGAPRSGIEFARPDLFSDRPWIFTPTADRPDLMDRLFRLAGAIGARPAVQSAEEHDRLLAYLGHLPQLVSSALMSVVGEGAGEAGLKLAGRGLADATRLATSPASAWVDVFAANQDEVGRALDELLDLLVSIRSHLDSVPRSNGCSSRHVSGVIGSRSAPAGPAYTCTRKPVLAGRRRSAIRAGASGRARTTCAAVGDSPIMPP